MPGDVVRVLHDRRRVVAAFRLSDAVVARLETRALDAGADAYLVARSLDELAGLLRSPEAGEAVASAPAELPVANEQRLMADLDDLIIRRASNAEIRKSE